MVPHWLAVDGVQPAIPENAPLERPRSKRARAAASTLTLPSPTTAPRPGGDRAAQLPPAAQAGAANPALAEEGEERAPAAAAAGALPCGAPVHASCTDAELGGVSGLRRADAPATSLGSDHTQTPPTCTHRAPATGACAAQAPSLLAARPRLLSTRRLDAPGVSVAAPALEHDVLPCAAAVDGWRRRSADLQGFGGSQRRLCRAGRQLVSAEAAVAAAAVPDAPGAPAPLPPVKHVLSRELQLYFERVAAVLRGAGDAPAQRGEGGGGGAGSGAAALQVQRAVLASLASDPGALRRRAACAPVSLLSLLDLRRSAARAPVRRSAKRRALQWRRPGMVCDAAQLALRSGELATSRATERTLRAPLLKYMLQVFV